MTQILRRSSLSHPTSILFLGSSKHNHDEPICDLGIFFFQKIRIFDLFLKPLFLTNVILVYLLKHCSLFHLKLILGCCICFNNLLQIRDSWFDRFWSHSCFYLSSIDIFSDVNGLNATCESWDWFGRSWWVVKEEARISSAQSSISGFCYFPAFMGQSAMILSP